LFDNLSISNFRTKYFLFGLTLSDLQIIVIEEIHPYIRCYSEKAFEYVISSLLQTLEFLP